MRFAMKNVVLSLVLTSGLFGQSPKASYVSSPEVTQLRISPQFQGRAREKVIEALNKLSIILAATPIEVGDSYTQSSTRLNLSDLSRATLVLSPLEGSVVVLSEGTGSPTIEISSKAALNSNELAVRIAHQMVILKYKTEKGAQRTWRERRNEEVLGSLVGIAIRDKISSGLNRAVLDRQTLARIDEELRWIGAMEEENLSYFQVLGDLVQLKAACEWFLTTQASIFGTNVSQIEKELREFQAQVDYAVRPLNSDGIGKSTLEHQPISVAYKRIYGLAVLLKSHQRSDFRAKASELMKQSMEWQEQLDLHTINLVNVERPSGPIVNPKLRADSFI